MKSGIYAIINCITGKFYIGSAVDLKNRKRQHFKRLEDDRHSNKYLQNAYNKYWGSVNFEFIVLEFCNKEDLFKLEQWWFELTKCYNRGIGYNFHKNARSPLGVKHSEASRKNMSEAHKGIKQSDESRHKRSESLKGRIISFETRRKAADTLALSGKMRRFDKWPCHMGIRCKCDVCRKKRSDYSLEWYHKNEAKKARELMKLTT